MPIPKIDTYYSVTAAGALNPFDAVPGAADSAYGYSASDFHEYLLAFHSDMPIFNDFMKLHVMLIKLFAAKSVEWNAKLAAATPAGVVNLSNPFEVTENIVHSGTDESESESTATDKRNTYDNATLRTVAETGSESGGSFTHGHEIDTTKTQYAGGDPYTQIKVFRGLTDYNLFMIIVNDIIDAVSCKIYTPDSLSNN